MTGRQWQALCNRVRGRMKGGDGIDAAIAGSLTEATTRSTSPTQIVTLTRMLWLTCGVTAPLPEEAPVPQGVVDVCATQARRLKRLASRLKGPITTAATARVFPPVPDEEAWTGGFPGRKTVRPPDYHESEIPIQPMSARLVKGAPRALAPVPVEQRAIARGWQPLDEPSIVAQFKAKGWRVA